MSRAYVLDATTRDVLGLVDQSWEKLTYTRRYWGMDTFTMTIQRARLYASTLQKGRLLYLPDEGDRIFLIEQIQSVSEGSRANDLMTVSGRSMEGPGMAERLVIPPAGQDYDKVTATPGETAMKHYVTDHASETATTVARRISGLVCVASAGTGANVTVAGRYQYVFDIVKQIGLLTGQGWEIVYNPSTNKFEFDVINGVDRSTSVFFDFAFETLERWEELDSLVDSKTVAVVAGQGEGAARDVRTRWSGSEPTGLARREAFIDARDIDLGANTELDARGDAFIAASKGETRLEAGIHQYGSFKYGQHWDMGDLVLIRNEERGISYTARVVEVSKSFDSSSAAPTIVAIIDRPFPTMKEQVSGAGAGAGAVDYPDTLNPKFDSITLDRLNADSKLIRTSAGRIKLYGPTGVNQGLDIDGSATDQYASLRFTDQGAARIILDYGTGTTDDFRLLTATGAAGAEVTVERLKLEAAGRLVLANTGGAADGLLFGADVVLYREAANVLGTDDSILVKGTSLMVGASTGAGQSADGVAIVGSGSIEMRSANPFIDFKTSDIDFGARIIYDFNITDGLEFVGASVYDFDNTVDIAGSIVLGGRTMSGAAPSPITYTGNGTWTKPAGLSHIIIECVGGGGAGGGAVTGAAGEHSKGGGGGGGSYSRKLVLAAALGATEAVTVGAGGTGVSGGVGNAGADSSFGTHCVGKAGSGGALSATNTTTYSGALGGAGGIAGTGDVVATGHRGNYGFGSGALATGGPGGGGPWGGGGAGASLLSQPGSSAGGAGGAYGAGGGGAARTGTGAAASGGAGAAGVVIVTQYYLS